MCAHAQTVAIIKWEQNVIVTLYHEWNAVLDTRGSMSSLRVSSQTELEIASDERNKNIFWSIRPMVWHYNFEELTRIAEKPSDNMRTSWQCYLVQKKNMQQYFNDEQKKTHWQIEKKCKYKYYLRLEKRFW